MQPAEAPSQDEGGSQVGVLGLPALCRPDACHHLMGSMNLSRFLCQGNPLTKLVQLRVVRDALLSNFFTASKSFPKPSSGSQSWSLSWVAPRVRVWFCSFGEVRKPGSRSCARRGSSSR